MQYLVINEKLPATNSTKINKNKIHSKKNNSKQYLTSSMCTITKKFKFIQKNKYFKLVYE